MGEPQGKGLGDVRRAAAAARGGRRESSVMARVRARVRRGGERLWRLSDFSAESPAAVAQALSRLTAAGELRRVGRGLYHRGRATAFGLSEPTPGSLLRCAAEQHALFASGLSALNFLGYTTQMPAVQEVSTVRASLRRGLLIGRFLVRTRRPSAWQRLGELDGALLEVLRAGAVGSELGERATIARTLALLRERRRFQRLLAIAATEPPRVRALLGALGEALGVSRRQLEPLRSSLNPLSRFEFGLFHSLPAAKTWYAKAA